MDDSRAVEMQMVKLLVENHVANLRMIHYGSLGGSGVEKYNHRMRVSGVIIVLNKMKPQRACWGMPIEAWEGLVECVLVDSLIRFS